MMLMAPIAPAADMMKERINKYDSLTSLLLKQNQNIYQNNPADSTKACWDYYSLWMRGYAASYADNPAAFFLAVAQFLQNKTPEESVMQAQGAGVVLDDDLTGSPYLQARAAVIEIENELVRLANNAEWDSMSHVYNVDGTIFPPGAPPVTGRNAIATFWRTVSNRGMHSLQLHS